MLSNFASHFSLGFSGTVIESCTHAQEKSHVIIILTDALDLAIFPAGAQTGLPSAPDVKNKIYRPT